MESLASLFCIINSVNYVLLIFFNRLNISFFNAFYIFIFLKVTKTELEKLKSSYRQLIKEVNSAKEKYKEAVAKGMIDLILCIY